MAKIIVPFTFHVSMEVKDRHDMAEIARTGRTFIQDLMGSDSIQDNIGEITDIRDDSVVDTLSADLED